MLRLVGWHDIGAIHVSQVSESGWPRPRPHEDVTEVLGGKLDALPKSVRETTRIPLGNYRGLRFGLVLHSQFPPEVYLEGATTRQSTLSREHQGPRAVLNGLDRLANAYGSECDRVRQDLGIAESQLRDYRERLGKPFFHDTYLAELTTLRDQLKAGLSGATPETGNETGPNVSELAERIKTLNAAHTIDATPERTAQRRSSAEEPVTARIRRMTEAVPASDLANHADAALRAEASPPLETPQNPSIKPQMTFQERITMERQRKDDGPSPP